MSEPTQKKEQLKKLYAAPKINTELLHETAALVCGKNNPSSQDCFQQPSSS